MDAFAMAQLVAARTDKILLLLVFFAPAEGSQEGIHP
jgi:hypothetical protein